MKRISNALKKIKEMGLYPNPPVINSPHEPETIVNGKKVLMFATNNYLGMLHDERVVEAAIEGIKKWGIGSGSARLLTGNLEIHQQLEDAIAKFKNREAGITFVSGYMANEGAIPAIIKVLDPSILSIIKGKIYSKPATIVFSDQYNHASSIMGIKLSGADKEIFNHNDMSDLEDRLKKYSKRTRKIIIVDGVFSMDGDITPLPDILSLAKKYNSIVYLDDAHATGILGKHGRGVEDYYNVEGESDIIMGTFTKCFGGVGGFIVGSQDLIDYLKISAKTFIFTAPIAPPVVCGLMKAIEIVQNEPWRREKLLENAKYLREKFLEMGLNLCGSQTQIIPILIGDESKAINAAKVLLENDIFIPMSMWPAVPKKMARLRLTVMHNHTKEQMDRLTDVIKKIKLT